MTSPDSIDLEPKDPADYGQVLQGIVGILEEARRVSVRAVNSVMTATYWEVGRRVVEFEQGGAQRAQHRDGLLRTLAADLKKRFGRGFSVTNLQQMRRFYSIWREGVTLDESGISAKQQTPSVNLEGKLIRHFPLPWSNYVLLMRVRDDDARCFYEREALAGGWSIRQLKRQVGSQFYERSAMSRDKAKMLKKGQTSNLGDVLTPEEEVKDPVVLEFLGSRMSIQRAILRQRSSITLRNSCSSSAAISRSLVVSVASASARNGAGSTSCSITDDCGVW